MLEPCLCLATAALFYLTLRQLAVARPVLRPVLRPVPRGAQRLATCWIEDEDGRIGGRRTPREAPAVRRRTDVDHDPARTARLLELGLDVVERRRQALARACRVSGPAHGAEVGQSVSEGQDDRVV